jgi:hypothetical protein
MHTVRIQPDIDAWRLTARDLLDCGNTIWDESQDEK